MAYTMLSYGSLPWPGQKESFGFYDPRMAGGGYAGGTPFTPGMKTGYGASSWAPAIAGVPEGMPGSDEEETGSTVASDDAVPQRPPRKAPGLFDASIMACKLKPTARNVSSLLAKFDDSENASEFAAREQAAHRAHLMVEPQPPMQHMEDYYAPMGQWTTRQMVGAMQSMGGGGLAVQFCPDTSHMCWDHQA
mmetsp:Transcript_18711/g.45098  ORF Transcript_18711/g.45098 Transcript_18711/m.45098 type:complete len:192 (-) Transcript_18711:330-905(-)